MSCSKHIPEYFMDALWSTIDVAEKVIFCREFMIALHLKCGIKYRAYKVKTNKTLRTI